MFVKFVPLHNGEVKHTKMQVDQDENLSDLREKLKSNFKAEHFKVLFHGRLINDFEKTLSHYKVSSFHFLYNILYIIVGNRIHSLFFLSLLIYTCKFFLFLTISDEFDIIHSRD